MIKLLGGPTSAIPGQAARLVIGRRRQRVVTDTSAFSKLTAPPKEPEVQTPGSVGPIRDPYQVAKGLGLTADAERDLTTQVSEWMQLPNALTLRKEMIKGLRGLTNTSYPVRREIWNRCAELWKNTLHVRPYRPRPGQQVIQKGEALPGGLASGRTADEFDVNQLAAGIRVEMEHTDDPKVAKEIAMDHLTEDPRYYEKLKRIEKSGGWQPIPRGKRGGRRRWTGRGWEYKYDRPHKHPSGPGPSVTLYHGTTEEGARGIERDGVINGPVYLTPRIDIAEEYGPYVFEVDVPLGRLRRDFSANIDEDEEHVSDWVDNGKSVYTRGSVSVHRSKLHDVEKSLDHLKRIEKGDVKVVRRDKHGNERDITPKKQARRLFIGPRGGKWANPEHTIPWSENTPEVGSVAHALHQIMHHREMSRRSLGEKKRAHLLAMEAWREQHKVLTGRMRRRDAYQADDRDKLSAEADAMPEGSQKKRADKAVKSLDHLRRKLRLRPARRPIDLTWGVAEYDGFEAPPERRPPGWPDDRELSKTDDAADGERVRADGLEKARRLVLTGGKWKREKRAVVQTFQKPAGWGWQPIPGGKHGGFRRKHGGKWEYWYPEKAPKQQEAKPEPEPVKEAPKPQPPAPERTDGVLEAMTKKKTKGERKKANAEAIKIIEKAAKTGRALTDEEKAKVALFSGAGGISGDLNAFYTRTDHAEAMWDLAKLFSGEIKTALEPSCGNGVFLETAPDGVKVTGVEYDHAAAAVSEYLHGDRHNVEHTSFENFTIGRTGEQQNFDVVVANPPYCTRTGDDIPLHKPEFRQADHYFLDTSIDHLKDGGVGVFLIHPGVLNAKGGPKKAFRERLLARAEVLDAFRLPDDTFSHVHCGISADIVVLRKRDRRVGDALLEADTQEALTALGAWDQDFVDGKYFDSRPDRILGQALSKEETGWRATVVGDADTVPAQIKRLTRKLEAGSATTTITYDDLEALAAENENVKKGLDRALAGIAEDVKPELGNLKVFAGRRYIFIGEPPRWKAMDTIEDVSQIINNTGDAVIKEANGIADDLAVLIKARKEGDFYKARNVRRNVADRVKKWVAENGIPKEHKMLVSMGESAPRLYDSIACVSPDGELSDILSKDAAVTLKPSEVDRSDMMSVANYIARRNNGYVSIDDIQHNWEGWEKQSNLEMRMLLMASGEYVEAEGGQLQHVEDYLTGDLYEKIDALRSMPQSPQRDHQLKLLEDRAYTKRRSVDDIPFQLEVMNWLPLEYFNMWLNTNEGQEAAFGDEYSYRTDWDTRGLDRKLVYRNGVYELQWVAPKGGKKMGSWKDGEYVETVIPEGEQVPGTKTTIDKYYWLKHMNGLRFGRLEKKEDKEKKEEEEGKKKRKRPPLRKDIVADIRATVEKGFSDWIKSSEHREEVEDIYNRIFHSEFRREYSGDALPLDGIREGIVPHAYQNQAVRWAMDTGRGIAGQDVGLGKTFIAILLARMRRQQGRAEKPMVVVPKSVAANWAEEAETLFPGSKVLVIGEEGGAERNRKLALIKQNDYDLIICTRDAFNMIPMRSETEQRYNDDDFDKQREEELKRARSKKSKEAQDKAVERLKGKKKAQALAKKFKHKESSIYWEDLGIDTLISDEAHAYKNLYAAKSRYGKSPKFLGGAAESKRSMKMLHMSRYVREAKPTNGVFFLTATPTKNSPLEVYNMLQHIAPDEFQKMGINSAEQFISRFCEMDEKMIIDNRTGQMVNDLCVTGFTNLKELEQIMDKYMMMQTAGDVGLKIPDHNEKTHMVEMSAEQKAVYADLQVEMDNWNKEEDPGGMLRILGKRRKAAQDLELYDPETYKGWASKSPKVKACVDEVYKGATERGGQIVFADYNASHQRLKKMLIKKGMKASEIAIINAKVAKSSEARQKIGDAFNRGEIKVVIGNTATMGEGVNLQGKKHAAGTTDIHHLDQPWDPGSMHQRNGRGVRQGNNAEQVNVHVYLSKGSADAYVWSTLKGKQRWLDKLRSGADNVNNDMAEAFSYEEQLAEASADPERAREDIKKLRLGAAKEWYAKRAQDAVDSFCDYLQRQERIRTFKGKAKNKAKMIDDADRIKRILLRDETLPKELKAVLEEGSTAPGVVATQLVEDESGTWLRAIILRPGDVIQKGDTKVVIDRVDMSDRRIHWRNWGHKHEKFTSVDDTLQYDSITIARYDPRLELKDALVAAADHSYQSPIESVSWMPDEVLEANREMIDEATKAWFAKNKPGHEKLVIKTPEGLSVIAADKDISKEQIVYPWGKDRAMIVEALATGHRDKPSPLYGHSPVRSDLSRAVGDIAGWSLAAEIRDEANALRQQRQEQQQAAA